MADDTLRYALLAALAIALIVAAGSDIASRRITNRLNGAVALCAPLFWWASGMELWPDIILQLGFALVCLGLLAGLFAVRAIGGGDVKLLVALALWISPPLFLKLVILMGLIGGVLALGFAVRRTLLRQAKPASIPYGVAIALAGLWVIGTDVLAISGGPGAI